MAYLKELLHFKPTNPHETYAFSAGYFIEKFERSKQLNAQPDSSSKSTVIGDSRGNYYGRGKVSNANETNVRTEKLQKKHDCSKTATSAECCVSCEKIKAEELLKTVKRTWNLLSEKGPVSASIDENSLDEEPCTIPFFFQIYGDSAEGTDETSHKISSVLEMKSYTSDDEATSSGENVKIKHSRTRSKSHTCDIRNKKDLSKKARSTVESKLSVPNKKTTNGFTYAKNKGDCIDNKSQMHGTQDENDVLHLQKCADNYLESDDRNKLNPDNHYPDPAKNRRSLKPKQSLTLTEAFGNNSKDCENFTLENILRELEKSDASNPGKKQTDHGSYFRRLYSYFVLTGNMVQESVCREECNIDFSKERHPLD